MSYSSNLVRENYQFCIHNCFLSKKKYKFFFSKTHEMDDFLAELSEFFCPFNDYSRPPARLLKTVDTVVGMTK